MTKRPTPLAEDDRAVTGAQSVSRALALLPVIGRNPEFGVSLSGVVEQSGLSRPTARRLLLSLMQAGMVEQDPVTKCYLLGEETYMLGTLAARRFGLLDVAQSSVEQLAADTGDTAFLSVRRDAFSLCIHKSEGSYPIRVQALQVGYRHPLGVGAASLAMLAALPDDEVEDILDHNAAILRDTYPRAPQHLLREAVAQTRATGWALNRGMVLANSWAIGRVLRLPDGTVGGAISVAAIDSRMGPDRQEEIAAQIAGAVRHVEGRLSRIHARRHPKEAAGAR